MDQLVPGDIVNIEAGDLVPADARILTAATLEIDESALTGESVPTPKQVDAVAADAALGDRVDMAFMNCQVTRGAGTILVVTTGMATEVGHISGMLQATGIEKTPLTKQLDALTNQILVIAGIALVDLDRARPVPRRPAPGAVPERGRVRGRGDPDGAAGRRHGHPVEGLADARRGRRDHEAPALGGDARLDVGAQLRQDRHADAQPDDRGPDGDRRAAATRSPATATRRSARSPTRAASPTSRSSSTCCRWPCAPTPRSATARSSATRPRARSSSSPPRAASTRRSPASATRAWRPCRSTRPTR